MTAMGGLISGRGGEGEGKGKGSKSEMAKAARLGGQAGRARPA